MNNAFVQRQADGFAEYALTGAGGDLTAAVRTAYQLALSRDPNEKEAERALAAAKESGLASLCWALLNSTEFVYVQ